MKQFDELNKVFDVEPNRVVPIKQNELVIQQNETREEDQQDDYQLARSTLRDLVSTNKEVLDELVLLAKQSEHPRTFEVVGQLVKTQSEIAKDLLGLHKQAKELSKDDNKMATKVGTQNNIVFAGSTAELLKLMKQQNEKIINNDSTE